MLVDPQLRLNEARRVHLELADELRKEPRNKELAVEWARSGCALVRVLNEVGSLAEVAPLIADILVAASQSGSQAAATRLVEGLEPLLDDPRFSEVSALRQVLLDHLETFGGLRSLALGLTSALVERAASREAADAELDRARTLTTGHSGESAIAVMQAKVLYAALRYRLDHQDEPGARVLLDELLSLDGDHRLIFFQTIARNLFPDLREAREEEERASAMADPVTAKGEAALVEAGYPPLRPVNVLASPALRPLEARGWVHGFDAEGDYQTNGRHSEQVIALLALVGRPALDVRDHVDGRRRVVEVVDSEGTSHRFPSAGGERYDPESDWIDLELVVRVVTSLAPKAPLRRLDTGDQTVVFVCMPEAAEKVAKAAGLLKGLKSVKASRKR